MVVLWLISGVNSRRCLDPKVLPFKAKRVRRQLQQFVSSEKVKQAVQALGVDVRGGHVPFVYGAVDVSVFQTYDHTMAMSELDREQCWYWRSMGVPPTQLWCFNLDQAFELLQPVPAAEYIARRFSKIYTVLTHATMDELCASLEVPGWLPAELDSDDELHLAVLLPESFAVLSLKGCFERLILPSAESVGWWACFAMAQAKAQP